MAILFDHAVVPGGQPGTYTFHAQLQQPVPVLTQHQQQHHRLARASEGAPAAAGAAGAAAASAAGSSVSSPRAAPPPQPHPAALHVRTGRERAALLLLLDLTDMVGGAPPSWLKCPIVGRAFVLDLLEFVLLHRPHAFHSIEVFGDALRDKVGWSALAFGCAAVPRTGTAEQQGLPAFVLTSIPHTLDLILPPFHNIHTYRHCSPRPFPPPQVCPRLQAVCASALEPDVEPTAAPECRAALRCVGALLRRHMYLVPDAAPEVLECVLAASAQGR